MGWSPPCYMPSGSGEDVWALWTTDRRPDHGYTISSPMSLWLRWAKKWSWSHEQAGRHAHIWLKTKFCQNCLLRFYQAQMSGERLQDHHLSSGFYYTPRKLCLWEGLLFSHCPSVRTNKRTTIRVSVTFCFLNILKNHWWNFIKFCKHIHMYKANTSNKN